MFLSGLRPVTGQESRPPSMAGRSTVYVPNGVIATSQPLATAAGLRVLQNGGNAIDAAVTAAIVLNVVEPMMTGIGGDLFAILWSVKDKKLVDCHNASGRSGSLLTRQALVERGRTSMPSSGAESITVPGALAGWNDLLTKYGTITLAQALAPAIELAEKGFPLTPVNHARLGGNGRGVEAGCGSPSNLPHQRRCVPQSWRLADEPGACRELPAHCQGRSAGLLWWRTGRANKRPSSRVRRFSHYRRLSTNFHRSEWVSPLSVAYEDYRLYELPPNGQGIAALERLRILEPYNLEAIGAQFA